MTKHIPKKILLLFFGDACLVSLAYLLGPSVRLGAITVKLARPSLGGLFVLLVYLSVFYIFDFYNTDVRFSSPRFLFRFLVALSGAAVFVAVTYFFIPTLKPGRGVFVISVGLVAILIYSWRLLFEWYFENLLKRPKRILIIGAGWAGRTIYELVKNNPSFKVIGFIDDDPRKWGASNSPTVLGGYPVLNEMVKAHKVNSIILAITHQKNLELLKCVMNCKMEGVHVSDMPGFYEEIIGQVPIEHVNTSWFVNSSISGVRKKMYNQKGKRALDIVCSSIGLVLSIPVLVITAVAIRLESSGPVLYRQRRVGLNGMILELIKFRSMRMDAEKDKAVWAQKKDSRVTWVGGIIRKLRIDEIPQMWNVLKGEMSFIGPRPERPEFIEALKEKIPYYLLRHSIKPGITGWAQVSYPYGATEKDALEKLKYDFFYIKNLTPLLDFHILLKTFRVVLFGRGAR